MRAWFTQQRPRVRDTLGMLKSRWDNEARCERTSDREAEDELNLDYGTPVGGAGWPGRRAGTDGLQAPPGGARAAMDEAASGASTGVPFRREMEAAFGEDFGGVRAFLGRSHPMAAMGANAAARGDDIAFGAEAPGRELVAHELTHVVQARHSGAGAVQASAVESTPGDAAEREAEALAPLAARGERVEVRATPTAAIHADRSPAPAPAAAGAAPADGLVAGREAALRMFMAGKYERLNHHPSTGGAFDVRYDPGTGLLQVTVKVHIEFMSGRPGQQRPRGKQPRYDWGRSDKAAWTAAAIREMEQAWSKQYTLHCLRPGWESVPPVSVRVAVQQVDAPGAAHFVMEAHKAPTDGADRDEVAGNSVTRMYERSSDGMRSPDVDVERNDGLLDRLEALNPGKISFAPGRADLHPTDVFRLRAFGGALGRDAASDAGVVVTVRGQAAGLNPIELNSMALAVARAKTVAAALMAGGARVVRETQLIYDGYSATLSAATIFVDVPSMRQTTLRHEFGHMLGVGDEYTEGARTRGAEVTHTKLVARTMPSEAPVRAANDERAMAFGDIVWPHHYVTFVDALVQMTHVREWGLQSPERPRTAPGDFPRGGGTDA